MRKTIPIIILIFFCISSSTLGQNLPAPKLVKTFSADSGSTLSVSYKNLYFFNHFGELWSSDGTTSGTVLIKAINPGSTNLNVFSAMRVIGNELYMVADDGIHGRELWKSDGTANGTRMIIDLNPNGDGLQYGYSDYSFVELNGNIFFYGNDGVNGFQLWKSDGTDIGTQMVKKINPNGSIIDVNTKAFIPYMATAGNKIFFAADDGVNGTELWSSDGTNTYLVKDFAPLGSSSPHNLIPYNDKVLFQVQNYFTYDIYISDGTPTGTFLLIPGGGTLSFGFNSGDYTIYNGKLYFFYYKSTAPLLYETDGTTIGTTPIRRFVTTGMPTSYTSWNQTFLTQFNNLMYFSGSEDTLSNIDNELLISDGTAIGTKPINVDPSYQNSKPFGSLPLHFTHFGGLLYFSARDSNNVINIWRTDGVILEKIPYNNIDVKINVPQIYSVYLRRLSLTPVGNQLFYWNRYNLSEGFALYKLDMFPDAISEVNKHTEAVLYPNPANNTLSIQAANVERIDIYSITGTLVQSVTVSGNVPIIDISHFSPAIYTTTISFKDGSRQKLKFVKQ